MVKTYQLKALWPLLPLEVANPPLHATWEAFGGGLVKYAVCHDGIWLFVPNYLLNEHEFEVLTGFHPADLIPKKIDGVDGYLYALQGGAPLLPIPFTKDQLIEFDEQTSRLMSSMLERGEDTDPWIADVEKTNPEAAELAKGLLYGRGAVDLPANLVPPESNADAAPWLDQLATPDDLIAAFRNYTGMKKAWFNNVKDVPALLDARKVPGIGGRKPIPPLFCPYEVMLWLTSKGHKNGTVITPETGWRLLKSHFPRAYALREIGDPNDSD